MSEPSKSSREWEFYVDDMIRFATQLTYGYWMAEILGCARIPLGPSLKLGRRRACSMSRTSSAEDARALALARFLDYVRRRDSVWVCRREDIARHWRIEHPG